MTVPYNVVQELGALFGSKVASTTKAKRPDLSIEIKSAGSAREVADAINSAWVTYGATPVEENEDGSYTFRIEGQEWETFDGAMQYLWFKTDKGDPNTYKMRDCKYPVTAIQDGNAIEVTVKEPGAE